MKTGNKEHLEDMVTLKQMIEAEMNKESRFLGKVLVAVTIFAALSPILIWWMGSR